MNCSSLGMSQRHGGEWITKGHSMAATLAPAPLTISTNSGMEKYRARTGTDAAALPASSSHLSIWWLSGQN